MHQPFSPILVLRSVAYILPSLTHSLLLERPQQLYEHLIEDRGNYDIPTYALTVRRSASELSVLMCLEIDSNYQPSAYQAGALTIELPKRIM
jgi:hypothetical protein